MGVQVEMVIYFIDDALDDEAVLSHDHSQVYLEINVGISKYHVEPHVQPLQNQ